MNIVQSLKRRSTALLHLFMNGFSMDGKPLNPRYNTFQDVEDDGCGGMECEEKMSGGEKRNHDQCSIIPLDERDSKRQRRYRWGSL